MLRACILTWVTRNILCTFHHRMNPDFVCHAREAFDFIICNISFFQKIHGNIDSFFCLLDKFSTILWSKHALAQSVKCILLFFYLCL